MGEVMAKGAAVQDVALRDLSNAIRALSMDAIQQANSGHPGMPMGMADVASVLFTKFLKYDASAPDWPDRDRFVLSAGHGSMLLYSLLYLTGYPGMDIGQIKNFRQMGSKTAGHPEYGHASVSWPSTVDASHPEASKRLIWSSFTVRSVGPSMEIELSSNSTINFESFRCPASDMASWLMPSIRHPSPAMA